MTSVMSTIKYLSFQLLDDFLSLLYLHNQLERQNQLYNVETSKAFCCCLVTIRKQQKGGSKQCQTRLAKQQMSQTICIVFLYWLFLYINLSIHKYFQFNVTFNLFTSMFGFFFTSALSTQYVQTNKLTFANLPTASKVLIPPHWFSFPSPFLSLTGSPHSPFAPTGSRGAKSDL